MRLLKYFVLQVFVQGRSYPRISHVNDTGFLGHRSSWATRSPNVCEQQRYPQSQLNSLGKKSSYCTTSYNDFSYMINHLHVHQEHVSIRKRTKNTPNSRVLCMLQFFSICDNFVCLCIHV